MGGGKMQKSKLRKLESLPEESLDLLMDVVEFLEQTSERDPSQRDLVVSMDLLGAIVDRAEKELEPISVRARTIIKQMNSGQFNNRKVAQLAGSILEALGKTEKVFSTVQDLSTKERVGYRRCRCSIVDLWNGVPCRCTGI